tara:strand:+ start:6412 stop:6957 length:546 start_codon:yes stop_codon:yes gene_type:complete
MAGKSLFNKVPYTNYDIFLNNKNRVVKNIFKVAQVVEKYQVEPSSSYEYIVKDGDTPEIISQLYYGSPLYHWTILVFNNVISFYDEWPLNSSAFATMIAEKYGDVLTAETTPHCYVHKTNSTKISPETYNFFTEDFERTQYDLYSKFEYENELNEKNRVIRVIRDDVVDDFVKEYERVIRL